MMRKFCRRSLISLIALALPFTAVPSEQPVHAQREGSAPSFFLLDRADCNVSRSGFGPITVRSDADDTVTISRRLFYPLYYMRNRGGTFLIACRIDADEYDTLSLQMGVPDNLAGNPIGTVRIYQGGNAIIEYREVRKGDLIEYTVDLENPNIGSPEDVTIEFICEDAGAHFCFLYLTEAELAPTNYIFP